MHSLRGRPVDVVIRALGVLAVASIVFAAAQLSIDARVGRVCAAVDRTREDTRELLDAWIDAQAGDSESQAEAAAVLRERIATVLAARGCAA
jgi:hypothetical protein